MFDKAPHMPEKYPRDILVLAPVYNEQTLSDMHWCSLGNSEGLSLGGQIVVLRPVI